MKIDSKKNRITKENPNKNKTGNENLRSQTKNINITLTTRVQTWKRGFEI